ncbi:MAG: HAD domain-containing protein [Candidatus Neomarinimicrobiota bacterium]
MKIIFLDIDGVLLTRNSVKYQYLHHPEDENIRFSHRAVKNLNYLIKKTGAKIVISSTWRLLHTIEELDKKFREQGIKGDIISTTSIAKFSTEEDTPRGQKISEWLALNPGTQSYVIIDDDAKTDCIQFHPYNCVETSYKDGFASEEKLKEALQILAG